MPRPHRSTGPSRTPWADWEVGARVVVRYRLEDGRFSDALGELLATSALGVTVGTRGGNIIVPAELIAIAKLVLPPQRQSSASDAFDLGDSQT
jgi:hypothetical protein